MKKLALALMCLVSVAFFASCDPEDITTPEPTIAILAEEGFVTNNSVVDLETPFCYGFMVASNPDTQKELSSLIVKIGDDDADTIALTGTDYIFRDTISLRLDRDIIGETAIVGTVTDVDGKSATATITLQLNETPLTATAFEWNRHGSAAVTGGIEAFGLKWEGNAKEVFAVIEPVEGALLYDIPADKWAAVTTAAEKAALFSDGGVASPIRDFRGVSAWTTHHDYNFVIGTLYNNEYHLIHITEGIVSTFKGTDIVIKGEAK